jgi:hypothetical protein
VVYSNGSWNVVPGTEQPYIFISYTTPHFQTRGPNQLDQLERLAQKMALEAGVHAYWLDCTCRATEQPRLNEDVHAIYDVVRSARQVCIILPDLHPEMLEVWGKRMWTLPKALLSSQQTLKFCTSMRSEERTKLSLPASV